MKVSAATELIVANLLPVPESKATLFDSLPKPKGTAGDMASLLDTMQGLKGWFLQWQANINPYGSDGIQPTNEYAQYLQFPNTQIRDLALSIVEKADSDDVKMEKIQQWVMENIKYVEDQVNYGSPEYWALPVETAKKGSGDCEDGAFLVHSLALNAGVSPERLRTYGGLVEAGENAPFGGHGWTAYMRESDDKWVAVDWCYYPETGAMSERQTLAENTRYFDDWFFVNVFRTEDTSLVNTMRGGLVNTYA